MTWKLGGKISLGIVSAEASNSSRDGQISVNARVIGPDDDHSENCHCPIYDCVQVWVQTTTEIIIADEVMLIPARNWQPRRWRRGHRLELAVQDDPAGPYDVRLPHRTHPDRDLCGIYPLQDVPPAWLGKSMIARAHVGSRRVYSNTFTLPTELSDITKDDIDLVWQTREEVYISGLHTNHQ